MGPHPLAAPTWRCFCWCCFFGENIRRTVIVLKLYRWFILTRKRNINQPTNLWPPWGCFLGFNFFFFKFCLWIWVLNGGERCLKVTLQKCAPENFHSCRWGAERRVLHVQIRERGPPSAWTEIFFQAVEINLYHVYFQFLISLSVSLEVIGQYWSSTISVHFCSEFHNVKIIAWARFQFTIFAQKMYVSRQIKTV